MFSQLKNIQLFKKEKEKKVKTHKKVFARVIAKQFLRDIKNNTIAYVEGNGFFRNAIESRLIAEVLPKFYAETAAISQEDAYYLAEANSTSFLTQTSSKPQSNPSSKNTPGPSKSNAPDASKSWTSVNNSPAKRPNAS